MDARRRANEHFVVVLDSLNYPTQAKPAWVGHPMWWRLNRNEPQDAESEWAFRCCARLIELPHPSKTGLGGAPGVAGVGTEWNGRRREGRDMGMLWWTRRTTTP